jgi:2-isopropylmalate synthase
MSGLAGTNAAAGQAFGPRGAAREAEGPGLRHGDNQLNDVFVRFKELADRKKEVFDEDLVALVTDAAEADEEDHLEVKFLRVICGTEAPQSADLTLTRRRQDHQVTAQGDGPVDAAFNAVKALFPNEAKLQLYQVQRGDRRHRRAGHGHVRMEEDGRIATGQSADTDTVVT